MAPKNLPGHDNVFVLGVKDDNKVVPAVTEEQVDSMLTDSLFIQKAQIDDFVADLVRLGDRPDIINYGSLMKHLQQECVFHLSALTAAALIEVRDLRKQLEESKAAEDKRYDDGWNDAMGTVYGE